MKKIKKEKSSGRRIAGAVLVGILFLLASVITVVCVWYRRTFDMAFANLLFVLLSPLDGTGADTVREILSSCLPPVLIAMALYVAAVLLLWKRDRVRDLLRRIGAVLCALALVASIVFSVIALQIPSYLKGTRGYTTIYEDHYVDPAEIAITAEGKPKNLIYVYLESMETTYASKADGGAQAEINYIPRLTALAKENQSFSDKKNGQLGGFRSVTGTGWTMAALLATTSGVPFSHAVFGENTGNSMGKDDSYMDGVTALGDILKEKGYRQEFLLGSEKSFAGQGTYLKVHGDYDVFDYDTAIEKGYIDKDYYVWWGYEDKILYQIARDEILKLAESGEPFNFTMQTMDTHHVGGYLCDLCPSEYGTVLENVLACSDRQLSDFIQWCQAQPFYDDTVIVITGDHPRMDTQLVSNIGNYRRTIYNCFLNSAVEAEPARRESRVFTALDIFPTTLAAMGFTIEGDRLGLGVNLFSDLPTLAEEYGYSWLYDELGRNSKYYGMKFTAK